MEDTFMLARLVAPNTLFRGRGMGGKREDGGYGDYDTPEETFPDKPVPGNWQVIYHGSHFMSYDPDPKDYVNGSFIIWHLADIVAKVSISPFSGLLFGNIFIYLYVLLYILCMTYINGSFPPFWGQLFW